MIHETINPSHSPGIPYGDTVLLIRRGDYGKMKRQLNWWTLQLLQAAHFMKFYGAFMWDSCVFKIIPMIGH
jgi:hypothetical protein